MVVVVVWWLWLYGGCDFIVVVVVWWLWLVWSLHFYITVVMELMVVMII